MAKLVSSLKQRNVDKLTERQREIYDWIRQYIMKGEDNESPTRQQIADGCGLQRAPDAQYFVEVLELKGYVTRNARGLIRLTEKLPY